MVLPSVPGVLLPVFFLRFLYANLIFSSVVIILKRFLNSHFARLFAHRRLEYPSGQLCRAYGQGDCSVIDFFLHLFSPPFAVQIMIDFRLIIALHRRGRIDERFQQIRLDVVDFRGVCVDAVDDVLDVGRVQPEKSIFHHGIRVCIFAEGEGRA